MPLAAESPVVQSQDFAVPNKKNTTRTITSTLSHSPIRRGLLTSRDKEFLSILSYACEDGICQIPHQELAERMGHCKAQAITKRLQRLEKLGYLKREGNHRKQKIHLCELPENDQDLSLTIPEHIWMRGDLSSSQKQLITVILAFPKVQAKNWTWWPDRIGMDIQSYKLNLRKIIFKVSPEPYKTLYGNPIRLYKEPYKTLYAFFGREGEDFGLDNNLSGYKRVSPLSSEKLSFMEDNKIMLQEINNPQEYDYRKAGYLKRPIRSQEDGPVPNDIMIELEEEVFSHKHLTTHRSHPQIFKASKIVKALRRPGGLSTYLDNPQIEQIITNLSTGPAKLNPKNIRDVIYKQFNETERIELYQRISDSMSPACGGKGKTISLVDSVYTKYAAGFSRLVLVWLVKPTPKTTAITKTPVPPDLEKAVAMTKAKLPNAEHNYLVRQLKEMKTHWDLTIVSKLANLYKTSSTFESWIGQFLEFAYNKTTKDHPLHTGWLNPGFWAFQEWEREWLKEMEFQSDQRQNGDQFRQQQEFKDKIEEACTAASEYGEQVLDDPAFGFSPEIVMAAKARGMYGYR